MRFVCLAILAGVTGMLTAPSFAADPAGQCAPMLAEFDKIANQVPQHPNLDRALALRKEAHFLCIYGMPNDGVKYLRSAHKVLAVPPPAMTGV